MLEHLPRGLAVVAISLPWGVKWITSNQLSEQELGVAKVMALAVMWATHARAAAVRVCDVARVIDGIR